MNHSRSVVNIPVCGGIVRGGEIVDWGTGVGAIFGFGVGIPPGKGVGFLKSQYGT